MIAAVRHGWWAWVHDPNGDYRDLARRGGAAYWPNGEAFIQASRRGPVPPIALFRGDPADLIRIEPGSGRPLPGGIADFASQPDPQAWDRDGRKIVRPTLFLFDESTTLQKNRKTEEQLMQIIARRRHLGLGLIFIVQYPGGVDKSVTRMATSILVFRTTDEDDLRTLKRRGVPAGYLPRIRNLPRFSYYEIDPSDLREDDSL